MPVNISAPEADVESTNTQTDRQDGSGGGGNDADADSKTARTSSQMATNRIASTSSNLPSEEIRNQSVDPSISISKTGRQSSQDGLLHISSEGGARRPIETSIWDWDTPLETVGESSSYYYEPQGELLQESRDQRQSRTEFSIPHAVSGSGLHWPFPSSAVGSIGNDGFAVPRRPSGIPPSLAGSKRKSISERESAGVAKQQDPKRASRIMSDAGDEPTSPAHNTRSHSGPSTRQRSTTDSSESRPRLSVTDVEPAGPRGSTAGGRRGTTDPSIPMVLPARKVFPIQIGDKLFRLSGASISSDAPSYFTQFFEEQLRQNEGADSVRTLYIDRDPTTFEEISLHLQGYHIEPRDAPHFVKLFADAQFFSLPRLTSQLFSSAIYIRIGDQEFQIPRDLFNNPGDSPNYFSLSVAIFFSSPNEVFPGLNQRALLRPPAILPPSVPNRSAKTFADLLHFLKGYPIEVRSEEHRAELLRDAHYFNLKGLEQRLIPHNISYNLARKKWEILIRLDHIKRSGITVVPDSAGQQSSGSNSPESGSTPTTPSGPGWVHYQRPFVDSEAYSLIVEISGEESAFLSIAPGSSASVARLGRATFNGTPLEKITSLFSIVANKMNLPITQPLGQMMMERGAGIASLPVSPGNTGMSEERVKVRIGADADVTVDGHKWLVGEKESGEDDESEMDVDPSESSRAGKKRKRSGEDDGEEWVVKKSQWRLRVSPMSGGAQAGKTGMEIILGAVKIEAYSSERARNTERGFLM